MKDPLRRRVVAGGLAALALPRLAAAAEWRMGAPDTHGMPAAVLDGVMADGAAVPPLRALLVARNGVLLAERYYAGASADQPRRINSATKSVVSLLVGQALAQGRLPGLSSTVGQLLPGLAAGAAEPPAAAVTLRQILTGTTGLEYDFMRDMRTLAAAPDPLQYVLARPRSAAPAGTWSYNDAAISLLTPILERAWGLQLPEIARQGLFAPLGIDTFRWGRDRSGQATAYMGLELRPRDFLSLVDMVARGGAGIVPAAWLQESLQPHTPGAWPLPPLGPSGYGYLWFNADLKGRAVAWCWGYGGQLGVVVPALGLSIVTLAQEPPPQALAAQNRAIGALVARLIEAVA